MRISLKYERLSRQTFVFDESDLRGAVIAYAKAMRDWKPCPDGAQERIDVEFDYDEEYPNAYQARITRTFTTSESDGSDVVESQRQTGETT